MFDTTSVPKWVSEGSVRKWYRAVAALQKANAERKARKESEVAITEQALFDLYVKDAGLVVGVGIEAPAEAPAIVEEKVDEKPKHRAKN